VATPGFRRRVYFSISAFVGVLTLGFLVALVVAGQLIAARPQTIGSPPSDLPAESIVLHSESGSEIAGWHIPADSSQGVVVLLHGIRGSRLSMLDRARMLYSEGYSIVMIDLQAHGESSGTQITIGHLEKHDARAAVEFAREQHPAEAVGVIGVSLGGASALLASPLGIDALVIESVYPDIESAVNNRVAARIGPLSAIPAMILLMQIEPRLGIEKSQLRPIDHVSATECPVLIVSGTEDLHTTAAETKRIFVAAKTPKELWLIDGAAHVDLLAASPKEYAIRVTQFFKTHFQRKPEALLQQ
jgi:alpha-beta hydrolase superfamily lysophospholipase